jgi:hypothetical protein
LAQELAENQRTSTLSRSRPDIDARKLTAMTAIVLLILFTGLAIASVVGKTTDSRDVAYGLGAVLRPRLHGPYSAAGRRRSR